MREICKRERGAIVVGRREGEGGPGSRARVRIEGRGEQSTLDPDQKCVIKVFNIKTAFLTQTHVHSNPCLFDCNADQEIVFHYDHDGCES